MLQSINVSTMNINVLNNSSDYKVLTFGNTNHVSKIVIVAIYFVL